MMFREVIAVYCKNDTKQIIALGERGRFFSMLKQVVHTIHQCLKGLSYMVTILLSSIR
jgi:hypothetical protein